MKIMRTLKIFLLTAVLACCLPLPALAVTSGTAPRLVDSADLLTDSEETELLAKLDEISERQQLDVVVVTEESTSGKTAMEYADDFYDNYGYGYGDSKDGVLLLVSMRDRDYWITTAGYGITAFTDAGISYISDQFVTDLSNGDYAAAFNTYADLCDEFITQAKTGEPYDTGNLPKGEFNAQYALLGSLAIGLIAAAIVTYVMRRQLKSVSFRSGADDYVREGSFHLTETSDRFLYSHVSRTVRQNSSSSGGGGSSVHISSSGVPHGGGGGKF